MNLKNDAVSQNRETIRDYLLLVLFTGLRREAAASMTWDNVDLQAKTLKVTDTKNLLDHTVLIRLAPKATICSMFPFNNNTIPSSFGRQPDKHGSYFAIIEFSLRFIGAKKS